MYKYLDYLFLPVSLWIATVYRFRYTSFELRELYLLFTSLIAWTIAASLFKLHVKGSEQSLLKQRIPAIITFFFFMTGMSFYAHNELDFSRVVLFLFTALLFLLPPAVIFLIRSLMKNSDSSSNYCSLIIGEGELYETTLAEYRKKGKLFHSRSLNSIAEISPLEILESVAEKCDLQEIILITPSPQKKITDRFFSAARERGIRLQLFRDNRELSSFPLKAESFGNQTHYRSLSNRLEVRDNRIFKRLFDILFSLLITILISPLLIGTTLILKLQSRKEPVLFRQKRTGYNQKVFYCFKFRSMTTLPQEVADTTQAREHDPRITKIGAFLRKSSIDELPQLFNVLRGEMSLVGPRPHPVIMNNHRELVPEYLLRHFVVPGMTGWAQVNGYRGPTDTEEKIRGRVEHDLWYIEHWSIWLDIKIMFLTLFGRKVRENAF